MTQAIESVIDLIELGAIAPEDIVKCLRSALTETRQWQGLTDEDVKSIWRDIDGSEGLLMRFVRVIEARLKEKNHG